MNTDLDKFLELVKQQIQRKAKLYDGLDRIVNTNLDLTPVARGLFSCTEELGEVASAITRHRYDLAMAECIDVAHSALLLYLAVQKQRDTQ